MNNGKANLTGHWTGLYNYPDCEPPVPFEAVLHESSGCLTGTIEEVSDLIHRFGDRLRAVIDGRREGSLVQFLKMYDADEDYDVVHYEGEIHPDGNEIDGRWDIAGIWSGTFLMIRASGAEEWLAIKAEEPVGIVR